MGEDEPFFVSRGGAVWACWLDGKPAVNLGSEQNFWAAAEKLFTDLHPEQAPPFEEEALTENSGQTAEHQHQPSSSPVERVEDRHEVTIIGRLYGMGGGSNEVTIYDLSERGCRIEDSSNAKPGSHVSVKIGTVGPVQAMVRWRKGKSVGLKFTEPLHPSVLVHIRQQLSLR